MQGATISLDIRLVLHDNPAKKTDQYPGLSIVLKGKTQETTIKEQNYPGWWSVPGSQIIGQVRIALPAEAIAEIRGADSDDHGYELTLECVELVSKTPALRQGAIREWPELEKHFA